MKPSDFIEQPEVINALEELNLFIQNEKSQKGSWEISDVIDPVTKHQYVDLVMEGGGMLGIALVGYVYALESSGIRFLRLGGTSAGAINAILMASGHRSEPSTDWLVEELANQNFYDFVDGDEDVRDFIDAVLKRSMTRPGDALINKINNWIDLGLIAQKAVQVIDNFRNKQGLNPGNVFTNWLREILNKRGIKSLQDLENRRNLIPENGLKLRTTNEYYNSSSIAEVAIVTADLTTQTKVIFPRMASHYWSGVKMVHPAELVRASMSIPLFFEPYEVSNLPGCEGVQPNPDDPHHRTDAGRSEIENQNPELIKWSKVDYMGPIPKVARFSDGGILSNFPIDLFHAHDRVPEAPTFGVKLGFDRDTEQKTGSLLSYLLAVFDTARTQYDFDFISKNPDYKQLVYCLDIRGFNWLDFNMPDEEKKALFAVGVRGGVSFLKTFNWESYKELRKKKADIRHFVEGDPNLINPSDDPLKSA